MKQVVVNPEKCIGCMQCMAACAVAHSQTQQMHTALFETPLPKPRVHVGIGLYGEGFPNRCRHCDPAPCQFECMSDAIWRDKTSATVFINPDECVNCASCAMVCPYGVIRFDEDATAPPGQTIAVKCDNCIARISRGLAPACTDVCQTGALVYEEIGLVMKRKTDAVARSVSRGATQSIHPPAWELLIAAKKTQLATFQR